MYVIKAEMAHFEEKVANFTYSRIRIRYSYSESGSDLAKKCRILVHNTEFKKSKRHYKKFKYRFLGD
jgi:hypothetical protein